MPAILKPRPFSRFGPFGRFGLSGCFDLSGRFGRSYCRRRVVSGLSDLRDHGLSRRFWCERLVTVVKVHHVELFRYGYADQTQIAADSVLDPSTSRQIYIAITPAERLSTSSDPDHQDWQSKWLVRADCADQTHSKRVMCTAPSNRKLEMGKSGTQETSGRVANIKSKCFISSILTSVSSVWASIPFEWLGIASIS